MLSEVEELGRLPIVKTTLRSLLTSAAVLVLYFTLPVDPHPHRSVLIRLSTALGCSPPCC